MVKAPGFFKLCYGTPCALMAENVECRNQNVETMTKPE
jgi:hypothetical protein